MEIMVYSLLSLIIVMQDFYIISRSIVAIRRKLQDQHW